MPFLDFKNKVTRFFLLAAVLYVSWYLLYELVIKPYTNLDEKFIHFIIAQASFVLKLMNYKIYQRIEDEGMQMMGIEGSHPVWIGIPCNAVTLFAFFTLFVIAFPGKTKSKLWFIPVGIVIIHIANLLRVMGLTLINYYAPEYLDFNHTYSFTIFVYSIIFALWMWWVNYSLKQSRADEQKT